MNETRSLILRIAVAILALAFVYYIRDVLAPIVISLFLFYILNPLVSFLSEKRPKGLGINISLSILISFFFAGLAIYLFFRFVIPPLAFEFKHFGQNIPTYIEAAKNTLNTIRDWYLGYGLPEEIHTLISQSIQSVIDTMMSFAEDLAKGLLSISTKFIQLIVIPVLTYYLLKDRKAIKEGLINLSPHKGRPRIIRIIDRINKVLNSYVKGIGILCLVIGLASTAGLFILGVIAGITEAIPFIGPWIGAVPAVIVAALASPALAIQTAVLYTVIQAAENHLLVPKVLGNQLELHPAAIIIAILILGKIAGAWGLFFAAPIVPILRIIYEEVQEG